LLSHSGAWRAIEKANPVKKRMTTEWKGHKSPIKVQTTGSRLNTRLMQSYYMHGLEKEITDGVIVEVREAEGR
jgi:hypothetical protein